MLAFMCPRCGKDAPVVYRGVWAYCTACNAQRFPLTGPSVTHAGRPSKVGGLVAKAVGWVVLLVGWLVAIVLGLLAAWIFPGSLAWIIVAGPIAGIVTTISVLLLLSGGHLWRSGSEREQQTREKAIFALAAHRGGVLSVLDVAGALGMDARAADAILTGLAKTDPSRVAMDLDDQGAITFRFLESFGARHRVSINGSDGGRAGSDDFVEMQESANEQANEANERGGLRGSVSAGGERR